MDIGVGASSRVSVEAELRIHCPACKGISVPAIARDVKEKLLVAHVVPVFFKKTTLVRCSCGASLVSELNVNDLAMLDPDAASLFIKERVPVVLIAMVLSGLVVWLFPVFGTVWLAVTWCLVRRRKAWMRWLTLFLLVLSIIPIVGILGGFD